MTKITDDNDNLIEVEDKYPDHYIPGVGDAPEATPNSDYSDEREITPGGYVKMTIDLDPEVTKDLLDLWARTNLYDASLEQYEEVLAAEGQEAAIYGGVLNDIIIDALTAAIEREEAELESEDDA